jgi:hypothetical protein
MTGLALDPESIPADLADLQSALEVILLDPDYQSDLVGLSLDDVRAYLVALRGRREHARAGESGGR